jgi:hypothetical protein
MKMFASIENYASVGLQSGKTSSFEPMHAYKQTNAPTYAHRRFHPYTGDVMNIQRHGSESYFGRGCCPGIGFNVPVPTETSNFLTSGGHNFMPGTYLPNNNQYQHGTQQTNYQWAFTQKSIQNLCELNADTGTNLHLPPSAPGKDRSHPFYSRKRAEPAAGMTRTRDKYRVVYTEKQRRGLEKAYNTNKFITTEIRSKISEDLGLSARQVHIFLYSCSIEMFNTCLIFKNVMSDSRQI